MNALAERDVRLVDVLPRAVLPELRLGDDDLLGHRRPSSTRSTIHRESQERELDGRAAADAAGRGAAAGAAAPAASALPVQHAEHDLGADASRRRRRRRDARAAQRSAAADAGSRRHAAGAAQGRSSTSSRSIWRSNRRASAIVCMVNIDVEPDTLDAPVPNLVLQPLVENALRHGIGPQSRRRPGRRDARRQADGLLDVDVRDNGVGLSPDKLNAFQSGVGLSNTRSRLEHLYGDRHRFEFQTPPGGGLLVTIVIPMGHDPECAGSLPRCEPENPNGERGVNQDPNPGRGRRADGARARAVAAAAGGGHRGGRRVRRRRAGRRGDSAAGRRISCSSTCRCPVSTASA